MMSADPELGYVYLPFGTPSNDWYGGQRPGDNLFGESLVCLNAQTGKLVWHMQMVHHGLWDYDLPAAPNLVDITVEGRSIKAVAQISKQGFVYVLDRITGEPVWPIEERAVPQSTVPGERSSATQPFPTKPAAFERQGITTDSLIDFTPELRARAVEIVSQFNHGGLYTPPSLKGTIQLPGEGGGAEWTGAAFDPETSILYIPSMTRPIIVQLVEPPPETTEFRYVRGRRTSIRGPDRLPLMKPPYGRVSAVNLNTGEYEWVVANGEGIRQKIIDMGIDDPGPVGSMGFVFPLVTKSLLFIAMGDGQGTNQLRVLDKKTGKTIHVVELSGYPSGAPMTYMVDGKQYISLALGMAKDAKLVTLALP
jgi:quinoprotein glucose dehydrogenase